MLERFVLFFSAIILVFAISSDNLINNNNINKNTLNSVVRITIVNQNSEVISATGFSVKYDSKTNESLILTNHHVCSEAFYESPFIYIDMNVGDDQANSMAEIVKYNASKDMCLLKTNLKTKPLKIEKKCNTADKITIVGAPNGVYPIFVDSYISNDKLPETDLPFEVLDPDSQVMMVSAMLFPGSSGSPVLSKKGKVCGIIFGAIPYSYGSLAMSNKEVKIFLESYSEWR